MPHVGEAIGLFAFKLFGEEPGRRVGIAIAGPDQRLDAIEARVVVLTVAYGGGKPLDAGVDLVDAAAHVGVCGQVFGNVDARGPLLAADLLERALQALRTIARRGEVLQADLVGFGFIHAAVVEHGGLPGGHAAREDGPAALPAAQEGGRQRADEAADGDGLRPFHAGGDVALGDVGQFVAEHAREFGLVVKLHDEPGVDEDGTARHGEGVHAVVQQHVGGEREGLRGEGFGEAVHNGLDVALDFGVFHKRHTGADEHVELASEFFFVLDAETAEKRGLHRDRALQEQGE